MNGRTGNSVGGLQAKVSTAAALAGGGFAGRPDSPKRVPSQKIVAPSAAQPGIYEYLKLIALNFIDTARTPYYNLTRSFGPRRRPAQARAGPKPAGYGRG